MCAKIARCDTRCLRSPVAAHRATPLRESAQVCESGRAFEDRQPPEDHKAAPSHGQTTALDSAARLGTVAKGMAGATGYGGQFVI